MTTVTLTSSERRHSKAILLAADAGQWLRPERLIDGRRAVGIPSQTKRGLYHWTDGITCSCYDFRRRQLPCKHVVAHRLDAIARPVTPQPAVDVVDGLAHMLEQRLAETNPVLEMVREPEGDITWRALSDKYDDVFTRFDDDAKPRPTATSPELARILGGPAPYVTDHVGERDELEPLCGPLCGATASGNRVCAAPAYHTGVHTFVQNTERED